MWFKNLKEKLTGKNKKRKKQSINIQSVADNSPTYVDLNYVNDTTTHRSSSRDKYESSNSSDVGNRWGSNDSGKVSSNHSSGSSSSGSNGGDSGSD